MGKKMQQHVKNIRHLLDLLLGLLSVEQSLGTAFPLQSAMYCHGSQVDSALRWASVVVRAARARFSVLLFYVLGAVCPQLIWVIAGPERRSEQREIGEICSKADLFLHVCREVEEWGHFDAALRTALCTPWIQYLANSSSCSPLALLGLILILWYDFLLSLKI